MSVPPGSMDRRQWIAFWIGVAIIALLVLIQPDDAGATAARWL